MKVTVTIDFPCSQEEWNRLEQIRALAGATNVSVPVSIVQQSTEPLEVQEEEKEADLLMDYCIKNSVGNCKPTAAYLIRDYVENNPACLPKDAIDSIMESHGLTRKSLSSSMSKLLSKGAFSRIGDRLYPM